MTADFILRSQAGDKTATENLMEKFHPLLKKYACRLNYDDAYEDLLVDFVELLHRIRLEHVHSKSEGSLVTYISKSIQSSYLKRLAAQKKLCFFIPYAGLKKEELYFMEAASARTDTYFAHEFPNVNQVLTASEADVVKAIYFKGYSVCETAQKLGISRQAVNQRKNRALKKLKVQLSDRP